MNRRIYIKQDTRAITALRTVLIPDWAIRLLMGHEFDVNDNFEVTIPAPSGTPTTWSLPPDVVKIVE